MPIGAALGTAAAGVVSAGIGASASNKASKAQTKAAQAAQALQQQQYNTSLAMGRPSYQLGQAAQGVLASAYGLPGFALMQYGYPGYQDPFGQAGAGATGGVQRGYGGGVIGSALGNPLNAPEARAAPGSGQPATPSYQGAPDGQTLQQSNDATLTSILGGSNIPQLVMNQPGYQTQLQQGLKAAQGTLAASGLSRSGAAAKGLSDYAQNTFGNYWDKWLAGIGGIAGVGQQTGQNITQAGQNNANQQGQYLSNIGNAQAQGALGAANAWSEGLGTAAGALAGYGSPGGSWGATPYAHATTSYPGG